MPSTSSPSVTTTEETSIDLTNADCSFKSCTFDLKHVKFGILIDNRVSAFLRWRPHPESRQVHSRLSRTRATTTDHKGVSSHVVRDGYSSSSFHNSRCPTLSSWSVVHDCSRHGLSPVFSGASVFGGSDKQSHR